MQSNGEDAAAKTAAAKPGKKPTMTDVSIREGGDLKTWLYGMTDSIRQMIPANTINPERFLRAAAIEISRNPKLMACTRSSVAISLGEAARLGLEPGALLGQAWLIPYNESKKVPDGWKKVMTCHFQIGYKGLIQLARRSETIASITADVVYENDIKSNMFFAGIKNGEKQFDHTPDWFSDRGVAVGYYAMVKLSNGEIQFSIMSRKQVENHRVQFSKNTGTGKDGKEKDTVWDTDFDAMALKTCIIKVLKLCPISVEALEQVNRAEEEMTNVTNTADDLSRESGEVSEVIGNVVEDEEDESEDSKPEQSTKAKEEPTIPQEQKQKAEDAQIAKAEPVQPGPAKGGLF